MKKRKRSLYAADLIKFIKFCKFIKFVILNNFNFDENENEKDINHIRVPPNRRNKNIKSQSCNMGSQLWFKIVFYFKIIDPL